MYESAKYIATSLLANLRNRFEVINWKKKILISINFITMKTILPFDSNSTG
jgi:hypothetical protein